MKITLPVCAFLNRLLTRLRGAMNTWIRVDTGFMHDLMWFVKFLRTYNDNIQFGMVNYDRQVNLEVDTSLEGMGALWTTRAYALRIPERVKRGPSITQFEMYNVVIVMATLFLFFGLSFLWEFNIIPNF